MIPTAHLVNGAARRQTIAMTSWLPLLGTAILSWLALAVVAACLGAAREVILVPRLSHGAAQWIGAGLLCIAILIAAWIVAIVAVPTRGQAWATGGVWVALTLAFDLAILLVVRRQPLGAFWPLLDLRRGEALPAVLVVTLLAPPLMRAAIVPGSGAP